MFGLLSFPHSASQDQTLHSIKLVDCLSHTLNLRWQQVFTKAHLALYSGAGQLLRSPPVHQRNRRVHGTLARDYSRDHFTTSRICTDYYPLGETFGLKAPLHTFKSSNDMFMISRPVHVCMTSPCSCIFQSSDYFHEVDGVPKLRCFTRLPSDTDGFSYL